MNTYTVTHELTGDTYHLWAEGRVIRCKRCNGEGVFIGMIEHLHVLPPEIRTEILETMRHIPLVGDTIPPLKPPMIHYRPGGCGDGRN